MPPFGIYCQIKMSIENFLYTAARVIDCTQYDTLGKKSQFSFSNISKWGQIGTNQVGNMGWASQTTFWKLLSTVGSKLGPRERYLLSIPSMMRSWHNGKEENIVCIRYLKIKCATPTFWSMEKNLLSKLTLKNLKYFFLPWH